MQKILNEDQNSIYEKYKGEVLTEDQTMLYNKWVSGIATRDLKGQQVTMSDIIDKFNNDVNGDKAPPQLPYPLTLFTDSIGEIYIKLLEMQDKIVMAEDYPVVQENEFGKVALIRIRKKSEKMKRILIAMTNDLNLILSTYGKKSEIHVKPKTDKDVELDKLAKKYKPDTARNAQPEIK